MKILAMDCGSRTGWAYSKDKAELEHGVEEFRVRTGESRGIRYIRFRKFLTDLANTRSSAR